MITILNSPFMYLVCGGIICFIAVVCVIFLVRAYRAGIAIGMDRKVLRRAVMSSVTFSVLPSVGILLGVIALSGSLGTPWPWLRLSVIGALHYETQVAQGAAEQVGLSSLSASQMTPVAFSTIALLMSVCIMWGMILSFFFNRRYLKKIGGSDRKAGSEADGQVSFTSGKAEETDGQVKMASEKAQEPDEQTVMASGKAEEAPSRRQSFGDAAMTAMFIGLVSTYMGSYIGGFVSGNGMFRFQGDLLPILVAVAAAVAMAVFTFFAHKKHMVWLESFSIAGSMLIGMLAAVLIH